MTEREFIFWLNGFIEIGNPESLDSTQLQVVKDHLALVLRKETPHRHVVPNKPFMEDYHKVVCAPPPGCEAIVTCGNLPKTDTNLLSYKTHASC